MGHINEYPHRGVTIINTTGFYTGREVKMMFILAGKREAPVSFRLIKNIDTEAFVSQSEKISSPAGSILAEKLSQVMIISLQ